jgi:hypothetical protein
MRRPMSVIRTRRFAGAAIAVLALAAIGTTALAGHLAGGVKSYTGCLPSGDGPIIKIKEGNAPLSPCTTGQTQVHFSGGDITAISAGTGLSGGGDNGAVALSLAAAYRLPQGCAVGQAVGRGTSPTSLGEWQCTQYTHAGESCPSGQFVRGTTAAGFLSCAGASGGGGVQAFSAVQMTGYTTGVGLNDDADFETIASISAPAGAYVLIAKGVLDEVSGDRAGDFSASFEGSHDNAMCRLTQDGAELDRSGVNFLDHEEGDLTDRPFALTAFTSSTAGVEFRVECGGGWDDIGVKNTRLVALRIG